MALEAMTQALDLLGVAVFAVTGALTASRKRMDIFGFALLATVTGIGGGTLRDLLVGVPVNWVSDPLQAIVCVCVAAVVFFTAHILASRYRLVLWFDALGRSVFAVSGAQVAHGAGTGAFVAVVMGVVSATFGGIIRDLLGGESMLILRR